MQKVSDLLQRLSEKGYRSSVNRAMLLQVISETPQLSADDIRAQLVIRGLKPNRTTVYREIEMLLREGILRELDFGEGKKRYEIEDGTHHHHLFCRSCEGIQCVSIGNHLAEIEASITRQHDFQVQAHQLEFFGVCADCRT